MAELARERYPSLPLPSVVLMYGMLLDATSDPRRRLGVPVNVSCRIWSTGVLGQKEVPDANAGVSSTAGGQGTDAPKYAIVGSVGDKRPLLTGGAEHVDTLCETTLSDARRIPCCASMRPSESGSTCSISDSVADDVVRHLVTDLTEFLREPVSGGRYCTAATG